MDKRTEHLVNYYRKIIETEMNQQFEAIKKRLSGRISEDSFDIIGAEISLTEKRLCNKILPNEERTKTEQRR